MTDRSHDGAEDTELLYTDLSDNNSSVSLLDVQPLKLDHCDLLLDAIDAQLCQLQVRPQKHQEVFRKPDCSSSAPLKWSQSLSRDTGLGSTTQTNNTPMSRLDLIHTPMMTQQTSERSTGCHSGPDTHKETKKRLDRRTRDKAETESRREQVMWRLERLLGDMCMDVAMAEETQPPPPSDSICTEDFVRRFREEMVEQTLDKEEEAESTEEFSNSDTCLREQKGPSVLDAEIRRSATPEKSSEVIVAARYTQSRKPGQREKFSGSCGQNIKHISDKTPQRLDDDSSIFHKTERLTVIEHENLQHINSCSPDASSSAGVSVRSFDAVSTTSNFDSVCTEDVHMQTVLRSSYGKVQKRISPVRKILHKKRECYSDIDKDTDEEMSHCSRRCRCERTSEKKQSDRAKMKERITYLRQKCEKEEEALRLKKTQLKDVDLCLAELRQARKHALQELERLTAETAQMEKEKRTLESTLSDSRAERDSISCQLEKLQKERESCLHEIRDMEEELATLRKHRKSLNDGTCVERNRVIVSVLEREEMERQLASAKTELFAEQRCAREKLESMQENLEEVHEQLQRATETERSLRNRCACLEKELIQKKEQIEALEIQVSELQVELGECKIRVSTLEKMLTQKDLQLMDFQEQCGALEAERDGLKGELQHLKTQHHDTLKEAQEQTQRMMVNQQAEEQRASALKEQTLVLTSCIESMQSSIQLKEEEVQSLKKSLEQQREAVKNCEKKLHIDVSEKVHKTVEEERRKWEVEQEEEKSKALALQHKVLELKTKVQELESESCAQQRHQESLLAVICKSLKEEHKAELQRLKKQMSQESQEAVQQLMEAAQLAKKEAEELRVKLEERESSHNQMTAELDQQLRHWAQELGAECQHLHLLVEQSGAKQKAVPLPASLTAAEALMNLRALREQLVHLIHHLHQELDSQKQTTQQLRKDKERELNVQWQQLRMERDHALDSLKQRLIYEHIEELSSLNRARVSDGGAEGGGVAGSLRKQLKAKDLELKQVQRSMTQWKEQTAARLACKFEEELTAELERCKEKLLRGRKTPKTRGERQRESERPEGGMMLRKIQNSLCSPSLHVVESAASHSPSDVASFKLLRYLQSRVKQLRLENQAYAWSPSSPRTGPSDLSGSYLSTIAQDEESVRIQSKSTLRTVSS